MKKPVLFLSTFLSVLAFLLVAVNPAAAAAGFVVSTATASRSGLTIVFLEYSTTPYFGVTTTFSQGIGYPTSCGPAGNGLLKCVVSSQLAKYHAGRTAYIIMNGSEDNKAFFVVPEAPPQKAKKDDCGDDQCCEECD